MCFIETTSNGANCRDIDSCENKWKSFHKITCHGLTICYQNSKNFSVEELPIVSPTEILSVLFRAADTHSLDISTTRQDQNIYC